MEIETQFEIKQEAFNGPIEVLLDLIEKRKLFVNDISLASITDDFISHIQTQGMHPDQTADFLTVAATLILIKARSLLPNIELTPEENESIGDLEQRIALYQIINKSSSDIIKLFDKKRSFEGIDRSQGPVFAPDPNIEVSNLHEILIGIFERIPKPVDIKPENRIKINISIGEVINSLQNRIEKILSCNFNEIVVNPEDKDAKSQKIYTIVSFLAMLELVRRGFITANQQNQFDNIRLEQLDKKSHL